MGVVEELYSFDVLIQYKLPGSVKPLNQFGTLSVQMPQKIGMNGSARFHVSGVLVLRWVRMGNDDGADFQ